MGPDFAKVLAEHEGCRANDSRDGHYVSSRDAGVDVWTCGLQIPFVDDLDEMGRRHLAAALNAAVAERLGDLEALSEAIWSAMPAHHTSWRGLTNEDRDMYRGVAARLREDFLAALIAHRHDEREGGGS